MESREAEKEETEGDLVCLLTPPLNSHRSEKFPAGLVLLLVPLWPEPRGSAKVWRNYTS